MNILSYFLFTVKPGDKGVGLSVFACGMKGTKFISTYTFTFTADAIARAGCFKYTGTKIQKKKQRKKKLDRFLSDRRWINLARSNLCSQEHRQRVVGVYVRKGRPNAAPFHFVASLAPALQ